MRPARIILIVVALLAGGLAAWLATRGGSPEPTPQVVEVVQSPTTQVLAAKDAIGVAERLSPDNVEWMDWPESAVRDDYVTIDDYARGTHRARRLGRALRVLPRRADPRA